MLIMLIMLIAQFDTYSSFYDFVLWLVAWRARSAISLPRGGRKTTWGLSRFSRSEDGTVPCPNRALRLRRSNDSLSRVHVSRRREYGVFPKEE